MEFHNYMKITWNQHRSTCELLVVTLLLHLQSLGVHMHVSSWNMVPGLAHRRAQRAHVEIGLCSVKERVVSELLFKNQFIGNSDDFREPA